MPDCLEATWQVMMAPRSTLTTTTYNVAAMSFSPRELAAAIQALLPGFKMKYTPDFRDGEMPPTAGQKCMILCLPSASGCLCCTAGCCCVRGHGTDDRERFRDHIHKITLGTHVQMAFFVATQRAALTALC